MTAYTQSIQAYVTPWVEVISATGSSTGVTYTIKSGKVVPFAVNDEVVVEGFTNNAYNTASASGTCLVTAVTSTTFKVSGPAATSGTTTVFSPGNAGLAWGLVVSNKGTNLSDLTVQLTGSDFTDIGSLRIQGGRADITAQPSAMTASIDLVLPSTESFTPNINQLMIVETYDYPAAAWKRLFVGGVTDITVSTDSWFDGAGMFRYTIQAASMLQKFQFRASQYTSSSIICTAGWSAGEWLDASLGVNPDVNGWFASAVTFSDPSVIMHKRSAGTYYDYDIASSAASSARGNLHDRGDGRIWYETYSASASPTFYSLSTDKVLAGGLTATKSITEIYNSVIVTSSNTSISSGSASDSTSLNAFGRRRGTKDTEVAAQIVVDDYANDYLAARKSPKFRYGSVTIDLASPNLTDADRTQLYQTRTNSPYSIAFPTQLGGTTNVLVDNWEWSFSRNRTLLTMQVCPHTDLHP